jgi:hypothetical protein
VHWVDDHLDTGEGFSTVHGLQIGLDEVGVDLMREAVEKILCGDANLCAQAPVGRTYRKPSLAQAAALDKKLRRGQQRSAATAKIMLKDGVAGTAVTAPRVPWVRLAKPRITVLLFHRVSDNARDNLTVGVGQFDRPDGTVTSALRSAPDRRDYCTQQRTPIEVASCLCNL